MGAIVLAQPTDGADSPPAVKDHTKNDPTKEALSKVALSYFFNDYHPNSNEPEIYCLTVVGLHVGQDKWETSFGFPVVIRSNEDCERDEDSFVDRKTGKPCKSLQVKIESLSNDEAIVSVQIAESPRSGGGVAYRLKRKGDLWEVTQELGKYAT